MFRQMASSTKPEASNYCNVIRLDGATTTGRLTCTEFFICEFAHTKNIH